MSPRGLQEEDDHHLAADLGDAGLAGEHAEAPACSLLVLDARALRRECLALGLAQPHVQVTAMASIEQWEEEKDSHTVPSAVLFHAGACDLSDPVVFDEIARVVAHFRPIPVGILADREDIQQVTKALECGVRGYIPTSVALDVCMKAINVAIAGGTFVPASGLVAYRQALTAESLASEPTLAMLTPREGKIAEALRQGKPNKIIAYEFAMCESTVKVHVRNIMRKLNATNRTEAAFRIAGLIESRARSLGM